MMKVLLLLREVCFIDDDIYKDDHCYNCFSCCSVLAEDG